VPAKNAPKVKFGPAVALPPRGQISNFGVAPAQSVGAATKLNVGTAQSAGGQRPASNPKGAGCAEAGLIFFSIGARLSGSPQVFTPRRAQRAGVKTLFGGFTPGAHSARG